MVEEQKLARMVAATIKRMETATDEVALMELAKACFVLGAAYGATSSVCAAAIAAH